MGLEYIFAGIFVAGAFLIAYFEQQEKLQRTARRLAEETARRKRAEEQLLYEANEARKLRTEYR
jgi:hypothetical protein